MLSAWADPSAKATFEKADKILAVYPINEPTMRRKVEDRLAKWIRNATPAYTILDESELQDPDRARAEVEAGEFDLVVALRVADFKQEMYQDSTVSWHDAEPYYNYYWGYSAYVFDVGAYFSRGYTIMSTTLDVETLVFDGKTGRKIFAARSRLTKPETPERIVDEIVIAVKETLRGAGMIP